MRKVMLFVVAAIAVLMTVACEKPREKKKIPDVYGYKQYSVDPADETIRTLIEEYEKRESERTLITYDTNGDVMERTKWYYDDSGEYLLKEVIWRADGISESIEYDFQGRCVREMAKYEEGVYPSEYGDEGHVLKLPSSYLTYTKREELQPYFSERNANPAKRELITEYSYRGDTDEIVSISTRDGDGKLVAILERGEGDIVYSEILESSHDRYEETYDVTKNICNWMFVSGGEVRYTGWKEYDSEGRCVRIERKDPSGSDYKNIQIEYDETGYWVRRYDMYYGNSRELHVRYGYSGRELVSESYADNGNGSTLSGRTTTDYLEDGRESSILVEAWNDYGARVWAILTEYEYDDENGISREYETDLIADPEKKERQLKNSTRITFSEDASLGKIRITEWRGGGESGYQEREVCLPDMRDRTKENWVCYSRKTITSQQEGADDYEVYGEFYDDGRLKTVVRDEQGYYYDSKKYTVYDRYDEQGLLCETRKVDEIGYTDAITVWEHWKE